MPPRLELSTKRWSTLDLPILPFLAPRILQPWPRNITRTLSKADRRKTENHQQTRAYHDGPTQIQLSITEQSNIREELQPWKTLKAVELGSCNIHGAQSNDEMTGADVGAGHDSQADVVREGSSEYLGGKEEFSAKYKDIWRVEATRQAPKDLDKRANTDTGAAKVNSQTSSLRTGARLRRASIERTTRVYGRPLLPSVERLNPPKYLVTKPLDPTYAEKASKDCVASEELKSNVTTRYGLLWKCLESESQLGRSATNFVKRQPLVLGTDSVKWKKLRKAKWRSRNAKIKSLVTDLPKLRGKLVRLVPEGPHGTYRYCSWWNWRISDLNNHLERAAAGGRWMRRARTPPRAQTPLYIADNFACLESLELMTNLWKALSPLTRHKVWAEVMLRTLTNYPTRALDVLMAIFTDPYPPGYAIADSLDYIFAYFYYRVDQPSEVDVKKLFGLLNDVLTKGPKKHVRLHSRTLYLAITIIDSRLSPGYHLERLFVTLVNAEHPLHSNTLIQFGTRFARHGMVNKACEILHQCKDQGADLNSPKMLSFFSILLGKAARRRGVIDRHIESDIFELMLNLGAHPNVITYNILLQNALATGDHDRAWQLHDTMVDSGLQPDALTYSFLLNDSKVRMDSLAIRKVIELVRSRGIRDTYIVNDVLHAILLLHRQERKDPSRQRQRQPSAFGRLLRVYCDFFELTPLARIIPNFSERFPGLKMDNYLHTSDPLIEPPAPTLVVMATSFLDDLQTSQPVLEFYHRFRELVHNSDPIVVQLLRTTHIYNIILMKLGEFGETLGDCHTLIADMLSPRNQTPQQLSISEEGRQSTSEDGQAIPPHYEDSSLNLHETQCNTSSPPGEARQPSLANGDKAQRTSKLGDASPSHNDTPVEPCDAPQPTILVPPKPDLYTWSILLKIFMAQEQPRAAEKVLEMMRDRGIEPNIVTWGTLAQGYASLQDTNGVVDALARMEAAGIKPDACAMNALNRIIDRTKLTRRVQNFSNQAVDVGVEYVDELQEEIEASDDELFAANWF